MRGDTQKTHFHQSAAGLRDLVDRVDHRNRAAVTLSVTLSRQLRYPPLP